MLNKLCLPHLTNLEFSRASKITVGSTPLDCPALPLLPHPTLPPWPRRDPPAATHSPSPQTPLAKLPLSLLQPVPSFPIPPTAGKKGKTLEQSPGPEETIAVKAPIRSHWSGTDPSTNRSMRRYSNRSRERILSVNDNLSILKLGVLNGISLWVLWRIFPRILRRHVPCIASKIGSPPTPPNDLLQRLSLQFIRKSGRRQRQLNTNNNKDNNSSNKGKQTMQQANTNRNKTNNNYDKEPPATKKNCKHSVAHFATTFRKKDSLDSFSLC